MPTLVDKDETSSTPGNKNYHSSSGSSESENRAPSEREANLLLNLAQTAAKFTTGNTSPKVPAPEPSPWSTNDGNTHLIRTPQNHDILSGRGQRAHNHSGNVIYRRFINEERRSYVNGNPREKKMIISKLLLRIKNMSPPGRFLKGRPGTGFWEILPDDEARKKTAQALRENAVNIRKIYVPEEPRKGDLPQPKVNLYSSAQGKLPPTQGTFLNHNDKKRKASEQQIPSNIEPKRVAHSGEASQAKTGIPTTALPRNKVFYHRANIPNSFPYKAPGAQIPLRGRDERMYPPHNSQHVPLGYPPASYQKMPMLLPHPAISNQPPQNDKERNQFAPRSTVNRLHERMQSDPPGSHCDEIRNH